MKNRLFQKYMFLLVALAFTGTSIVDAQTKLQIAVYSVNDGRPLDDVKITLINNSKSKKTDTTGIVLFEDIQNTIDVLSIEKEGYEGLSLFVNLESNKFNKSTFTLTPILGEVEVTAEEIKKKLHNSGFYERKEKASGRFLDEEDIKRKNPYRVTDIFTGTAGIKLERIDGNLTVVTTRQVASQGKILEDAGPCPLKILVNGAEIGLDLENIDSSLDVNEITAVEIYNSPASTPIQYNRFASCGVVLIWTK